VNCEHVFAIVLSMALRWALAQEQETGALFPDERVAERHVGKGAYAGLVARRDDTGAAEDYLAKVAI